MPESWIVLYRLVDLRTRDRRWIYVVCGLATSFLAVWSMEESVWGATPCVIVLLLLAFQFFRPTLLGWSFLFLLFAAYGIAIVWQATVSGDYFMGSFFGLLPAVVLLWARPKPLGYPTVSIENSVTKSGGPTSPTA